jgi:hypothetical protein
LGHCRLCSASREANEISIQRPYVRRLRARAALSGSGRTRRRRCEPHLGQVDVPATRRRSTCAAVRTGAFRDTVTQIQGAPLRLRGHRGPLHNRRPPPPDAAHAARLDVVNWPTPKRWINPSFIAPRLAGDGRVKPDHHGPAVLYVRTRRRRSRPPASSGGPRSTTANRSTGGFCPHGEKSSVPFGFRQRVLDYAGTGGPISSPCG